MIDKDAKKMWLQAAQFGYLGIFFGIAIVIGHFAGAWADRRLHTGPWLSLVGLLLGVATGFRELYRLVRQYQREVDREDRRSGPSAST